MLKHVGRIGDRKVAVVFREVPGEDHMALVAYTETLPAAWHDTMMKVIEGQPAQTSTSLADVLARELLPDGRAILNTLHKEGKLKKVQTKEVLMTPQAGHPGVRLDELNKIVNEIDSGEEAAKRLAELDAQAGMAPEGKPRDAMGRAIEATANAPVDTGALQDTDLANNMKAQAAQMEAEAKGLIAEATRLKTEAAEMLGEDKPKKRGRPPKNKAVTSSASK